MKEQIIQIPDTLEIKEIKDGKIILVEKEKLTYEDIAKELFPDNKIHYYSDSNGRICVSNVNTKDNCYCENNAASPRQLEKLLAINKVMNTAKYLNGNWQPDWNDEYEEKWHIYVEDNQVNISYTSILQCIDVYFKSEELAQKAIEILGEETIKLALCTDY